jgi:hypothetical protein
MSPAQSRGGSSPLSDLLRLAASRQVFSSSLAARDVSDELQFVRAGVRSGNKPMTTASCCRTIRTQTLFRAGLNSRAVSIN